MIKESIELHKWAEKHRGQKVKDMSKRWWILWILAILLLLLLFGGCSLTRHFTLADFISPGATDAEFLNKEIDRLEAMAEDCNLTDVSCGVQSIYLALEKLGIQASICEINERGKPGILGLRSFLSIVNKDTLSVIWPSQIKSILGSYGLEVETKKGDEEMLRVIAIGASEGGRAVIIRIALDEKQKLLNQHYEFVQRDWEGKYLFLEKYPKPILEIYIVSKRTP